MEILYTARFLRSLKKMSEETQKETITTLQLLSDEPIHPILKIHKLTGKWRGYHAISVDFRYRIILKMTKKGTYCMDIGTHDIYR